MDKEQLEGMIKECRAEIDQIKSEMKMLHGKLQRAKQRVQEYQMNLEKVIKEEKQTSLTP